MWVSTTCISPILARQSHSTQMSKSQLMAVPTLSAAQVQIYKMSSISLPLAPVHLKPASKICWLYLQNTS